MGFIYHYILGDVPQLSKDIITEFIKYSSLKNYFIIHLNNPKFKSEYDALFKELHFSNYEYCGIQKISFLDIFKCIYFELRHPIFALKRVKLSRFDFKTNSFLLNFKGNNIVAHGELSQLGLNFLRIINYKKISHCWVCWGSIPKLMRNGRIFTNLRPYSQLVSFIINARKIICLTNSDSRIISNRFMVNNTIFRPYVESIDFYRDPLHKDSVIVGNSAHYLREHMYVTKLLSHIKGVNITYMVNYGITNKNEIDRFKKECELLAPFSNRIYWEEVVPFAEYEKILGSHSVYISGIERQSGLGAIYSAISMGLKIYLTGVNYEHLRDMGITVHHINELKSINRLKELYDENVENLKNNKKVLKKLLDPITGINAWDIILKELSNE